jgi:uncharacterized membrane protein
MPLRIVLALPLLAAVACGTPEPLPECPPQGTALTWESFGKAFFEANCTSCHGGESPTGGLSFERHDGVKAAATAVHEQAGGANDSMPPFWASAKPTAEERTRLAEWLACGAP